MVVNCGPFGLFIKNISGHFVMLMCLEFIHIFVKIKKNSLE